MAICKTIEIDGREVPFRASAAVPRQYRIRFRRDIFRDLLMLKKAIGDKEQPDTENAAEAPAENSDDETSALLLDHLEIFENIAYIMAKHADASIPNTPDEWLDGFSTFSIYEVLPELLDSWACNMETQVQSKKNLARLTAK